jgi:hypothetical protein
MWQFLKEIGRDVRSSIVDKLIVGALFILAAIGITIWKAVESQPIPWTLFTVAVLVAIILFVVAIVLLTKTHKASVRGKEPESSAPEPVIVPTIADSAQDVKPPFESSSRLIVDVTPEYLMELFREHTSIQGQRLIEPYIGKWMRVSGLLGDVSNNEYFSQVVFEHRPRTFTALYMYFRQPDRSDRLSVLPRKTKLTVLGQIERVTSMEVHLDNCELYLAFSLFLPPNLALSLFAAWRRRDTHCSTHRVVELDRAFYLNWLGRWHLEIN